MKNALIILGLNPHHIASASDVKHAYRKLALVNHPDKAGNTEEFHRIKQAYELLVNGAPDHGAEVESTGTMAKIRQLAKRQEAFTKQQEALHSQLQQCMQQQRQTQPVGITHGHQTKPHKPRQAHKLKTYPRRSKQQGVKTKSSSVKRPATAQVKLPDDGNWFEEHIPRSNPNYSKHIDNYYIFKPTGTRMRSKLEVQRFMDHYPLYSNN